MDTVHSDSRHDGRRCAGSPYHHDVAAGLQAALIAGRVCKAAWRAGDRAGQVSGIIALDMELQRSCNIGWNECAWVGQRCRYGRNTRHGSKFPIEPGHAQIAGKRLQCITPVVYHAIGFVQLGARSGLIGEQGGKGCKDQQPYGDGNHQLDQRQAALQRYLSLDSVRESGI